MLNTKAYEYLAITLRLLRVANCISKDIRKIHSVRAVLRTALLVFDLASLDSCTMGVEAAFFFFFFFLGGGGGHYCLISNHTGDHQLSAGQDAWYHLLQVSQWMLWWSKLQGTACKEASVT